MSQMTTRPGGLPRSAPPDIYTVLVLVAFLSLLFAMGVLIVKGHSITGEWNPFHVMTSSPTGTGGR